MLGYWVFAVCYLLTIAYLVYLIDRQRRRIDIVINEYIYDLHKSIDEIWRHILDKERDDRELWAKYILKLQELEDAKEG